MVQERDRLRRDWVVFAWYFLHNGEMPDDEAVEIYAREALEWSETNRAVVERYVLIHARHRNMLLARISAPEESVRTKEVNLWDIQLPEDIRVIRAALSENEEYQTLRKQAERWEK